MNKGEFNELLVKLKLIECRDNGKFVSVIKGVKYIVLVSVILNMVPYLMELF